MEFAEFARRAREVEAASADTEVVELVADLFSAAGDDLGILARFVQGRVFPAWDSTKLEVGPSYCYEAIARAAGPNVSADDVERRVAEVGEVGEVAASYDFAGQRGLGAFAGGGDADGRTVREVFREFERLAAAEGSGSQGTKVDVLFGLFNRADPDEARYVARLALSEMRIGVGPGTVRDAVAAAFDVPVEAVERALQVTNDYGRVAEAARDEGVDALEEMGLSVGRPVQAMLAQAGTVTEALDEWDEAAVQHKFDGARVQIHHDGETTDVFSRNMVNVTDALPEVVEFADRHLGVPAILDGEVVAVDGDGDPLPFQEVLRRFRRKHDVERAREDVSVTVYVFDCLHVGVPESEADSGASRTEPDPGEDLLSAPLAERYDRLSELLSTGVADLWVTDDADEIERIEREALAAGHEGILLKNPAAAYTPGRRGKNWLKRKPDVETLDLVVTGAEWGEGRRANLVGTFQVSARTDGGFEPVGNVATGITDERLSELTDLVEPHVRSEDGRDLDLDPAVVFEVGYEEIQESPTYASGFALRFPRFVGVRHDKDPSNADSVERVRRLADRT
ncbi:DNA ligase [Halobacteriales archaeon QS_8_69_26]|nr:MAG: DNA ligase [Halobacteriales archaeon QS_8_69_26]